MTTWIKKYPLIAFYILAFTITWLTWMPQAAYSHDLFPFDSPVFYIVAGIGPMLAAYIVLRVQYGRRLSTSYLRPFCIGK